MGLDAHAIFIGPYQDEDYRRFFESVVGAGLADRVHVVGYVADVVSSSLQSVHGLFLLLSSQEGLPGALAEAMAHGMPVVVTAVGAMGQVVVRFGCWPNRRSQRAGDFRRCFEDLARPYSLQRNGTLGRRPMLGYTSPQAAASTYLKALTTIEGSL